MRRISLDAPGAAEPEEPGAEHRSSPGLLRTVVTRWRPERVPRIVYCGDTDIGAAAGYLGSLLATAGLPFVYLSSHERLDRDVRDALDEADLLILSDFPASNIDAESFARIAARRSAGMGMLMIGGWESFTGSGGGYASSPMANVLPVELATDDDRMNAARPIVVLPEQGHEILDGLSFESAPTIAGMNRVSLRPGAKLLLTAAVFDAVPVGGVSVDTAGGSDAGPAPGVAFRERERLPLLAVDDPGGGRVAALMCDLAPHWVGGFVDWGSRRIEANTPFSAVEVGDAYARFALNLVLWTAGWSVPGGAAGAGR